MHDRSQQKALIVHPQLTDVQLIKVTLEANGYVVRCACGEKAGLRAFFTVHPDVVILAGAAPGWNGLSFIERIRLCSDLPILLLADPATCPLTEGDGCIRLAWPAAPAKLLSVLDALLPSTSTELNEQGVPKPDKQQSCELILDRAQRQVLVRDRFVKLTPREYELLVYLIEHAGRILRINQILEHVWGCGHTAHEHYVHTYIWRLRHKIEPDPVHPRYLLNEYSDGFYLAAALPQTHN